MTPRSELYANGDYCSEESVSERAPPNGDSSEESISDTGRPNRDADDHQICFCAITNKFSRILRKERRRNEFGRILTKKIVKNALDNIFPLPENNLVGTKQASTPNSGTIRNFVGFSSVISALNLSNWRAQDAIYI